MRQLEWFRSNTPVSARILCTALFGLCVYLSPAHAQFDGVTLNGTTVEAEEFESFKRYSLPAGYCAPHTDKLVVQRVVNRKLLIEEGLKIHGAVTMPENEQTMMKQFYRAEYGMDEFSEGGDVLNVDSAFDAFYYKDQTLRAAVLQPSMDMYLDLLSQNSELLVNVDLVRVAKFTVGSHSDAETVLKRLQAGDTFDGLAEEFGRSGNDYFDSQNIWFHGASFPAVRSNLNGDKAISESAVFEPWYVDEKWYVAQVIETKKRPVFLLDETVSEVHSTLSRGLHTVQRRQYMQDTYERLWTSADINVNGESLAFFDESFCGFPKIYFEERF